MIGYYATVRDGARSGLLMGPYQSHELAEGVVDEAKRRAALVNRDAHWFAYGTARVRATTLPAGRLNAIDNNTGGKG